MNGPGIESNNWDSLITVVYSGNDWMTMTHVSKNRGGWSLITVVITDYDDDFKNNITEEGGTKNGPATESNNYWDKQFNEDD